MVQTSPIEPHSGSDGRAPPASAPAPTDLLFSTLPHTTPPTTTTTETASTSFDPHPSTSEVSLATPHPSLPLGLGSLPLNPLPSSSLDYSAPTTLIGLTLKIKSKDRGRWAGTERDNAVKKRPSYYRPSAVIYEDNGITILTARFVDGKGEIVEGYGERVMKLFKLGDGAVFNKNKLYSEFIAGVKADQLFKGTEKPYIPHEEFGVVVVQHDVGGAKTQTKWLCLTMRLYPTWDKEITNHKRLLDFLKMAEKLYQSIRSLNALCLHGDVKPGNIVVVPDEKDASEFSLKFIDLETAVDMNEVLESGVGGTLTYLAVGPTARRLLFALDSALEAKRISEDLYRRAKALLNEDDRALKDPSCKETDVWALGMMCLEVLAPEGLANQGSAAVDLLSLETRLDHGVEHEEDFLDDLHALFQHFVNTYDTRGWEANLIGGDRVKKLLRLLISRGMGNTLLGNTRQHESILGEFKFKFKGLIGSLALEHPIPLPPQRTDRRKLPPSSAARAGKGQIMSSGNPMASIGKRKRTLTSWQARVGMEEDKARKVTHLVRSWDPDAIIQEVTALGNKRVQQPDGSWTIEQYIIDIDGVPTIRADPPTIKGKRSFVCRLPGCAGNKTFAARLAAKTHAEAGNPSTCPWVTETGCTHPLMM